MKWRRRPYEVEAVVFTEDNIDEVKRLIEPLILSQTDGIWTIHQDGEHPFLGHFLDKNDIVLKEDGQISVWEKDAFLSKYERVSV